MYDLIIIGGGPSGASAGRRAGKLGLKTLLLEKAEFPRYKPCGGGLSDHAISYLDFKLPESILEWEVTGAKVRFKAQLVEAHSDHRVSTLVSRARFDNLLLEKAEESGIEVHTKEKVLTCREFSDCVEVTSKNATYKAKFAIIAEGAHGSLKTCVRPVDTKSEYGICVVTEVPAKEPEMEARLGRAVEVEFGVAGGGYGWVFPHKTYYSVGIGGFVKALPHPKQVLLDFLKKNGFTGEYKLHGHKIPWGGLKRKVTGSRVLLSGDAGGFVDAFSGEGLAYAIRTGQLAAETLAEVCQKEALNSSKRANELKKYEKLCKAEFGSHLKYSRIFSKMMHRFPDKSFRLFTSNEKLLDKYLEVVDFNMDYKAFLRWALLNFKLG